MSDFIQNLKANTSFWEVAFIGAFVLLILSHKISLEGTIE